MKQLVLEVKKLKKVYPGKEQYLAVDEISFYLQEGEILGFLGPNGSGKTTTIQMLLGTLSKTSGEIIYFGKDFDKYKHDVLQHIAFASTYTSLPHILSVKENLVVFGALYGLSKEESIKRFMPLLERFGIANKLNSKVGSLSAGQITRLVLVKAFFIQPKIVLLDEPTASLDPDIAKEICQFILEQREKQGLSILFTSHKMEEVMAVCDRTIFLKGGKIIADDLPENLAKSVSRSALKLHITDGMKRTIALAEGKNHKYTLQERMIHITLDAHEIPPFLHALSKAEVNYANITIEEPTLEEYFLQIARNK